jgi:hypothetical protein
MLAPLAFGLTMASRRWWIGLAAATITIVLVEVGQAMLGTGLCEAGDATRNLVGALVGAAAGWCAVRLTTRLGDKGAQVPFSLTHHVLGRAVDEGRQDGYSIAIHAGTLPVEPAFTLAATSSRLERVSTRRRTSLCGGRFAAPQLRSGRVGGEGSGYASSWCLTIR